MFILSFGPIYPFVTLSFNKKLLADKFLSTGTRFLFFWGNRSGHCTFCSLENYPYGRLRFCGHKPGGLHPIPIGRRGYCKRSVMQQLIQQTIQQTIQQEMQQTIQRVMELVRGEHSWLQA